MGPWAAPGNGGTSLSYDHPYIWKVLSLVLFIIIMVHLFDHYQG